jgi:putative transcriptional regulator
MKNSVRELRTEHGWSQGDLADKLEVSRQTVNAIETGRYDPSLPLAFAIAKLFGKPIEKILGKYELKDGVAKIFETLVVKVMTLRLMAEAGVRQGLRQEQRVPKLIMQTLFERIHRAVSCIRAKAKRGKILGNAVRSWKLPEFSGAIKPNVRVFHLTKGVAAFVSQHENCAIPPAGRRRASAQVLRFRRTSWPTASRRFRRSSGRKLGYLEFRGAAFHGWHPQRREMLIGTRFGDTTQLHLVKMPGGDRRQITFGTEPVSRDVPTGKRHVHRLHAGLWRGRILSALPARPCRWSRDPADDGSRGTRA